MPTVTVAIAGCAHGEMDKIYATLKDVEEKEGKKADILLCCGDFQSVRNYGDLRCMHVPPKYQELMTFYKYYSGEVAAPVLTLFVGGNHEASNYLAELPLGGWVAPNIYFMGLASVLNFKGLRIGGLSGIAGKRSSEYHSGHWECPPYNESAKVTAYHVRSLEVFRLKQLSASVETRPVDVFLSHDWPAGVTEFGDADWLVRKKQHFADEVAANQLGSPHTLKLLYSLKPRYWFSAHLHVKFAAMVPHEGGGETRFLALDKCLPHRGFLQLLDIEVPEERGSDSWLSYDPEWLSVLRLTDSLTNTGRGQQYMPGPGMGAGQRFDFAPTPQETAETVALFPDADLTVPSNFAPTAPAHKEGEQRGRVNESYALNGQTGALAERLGVQDLNAILFHRNRDRLPPVEDQEPEPPRAPEPRRDVADLFDAFECPDEQSLPTSVLSRLRLPEPKHSLPSPTLEDEKPEFLKDFAPPPIKRPCEKEEKSGDEEPKAALQFKRRNADMYKAEEDEPPPE